ncbi:MAG TPA: SDR family NAD(P)-dependent oxidoreductase [Chloroflexota bacterium]|nr:SDR family NAD(P)-dependent oxidoreductase [Chloroflexota bacterium]
MELGLRGLVALVTGAAGGIGRETALLLAEEGAAVAVADVRVEGAEETAAEVRRRGAPALALPLDVTDEASVGSAVRAAGETLGPLEVLVNSAGIYRVGALDEVTPEAWDATLAVNLRGTFLVCRAVLPGMLARGRGSVVNLSSISGRTKATLAAPSYVASKAGVIGLTMSLAAQGAARGVRVNAVAPGPADTEMIRTLDPEMQARLLQTLPMGRLASAREVAQAIVFLASPCASYITGETLNVNGGAFMV